MSLHFGGPQGLGALSRITTADMRAWMASARGAGTGARSLARKLSAVKKFYGWLAKREGFEPTAVLSTRAPKFQKKLPRPLDKDAARAMIDTVELQSLKDWVAARDVAVVTLLYGCGLRISEALGLMGKDAPCPQRSGSPARVARSALCRFCPLHARPWIATYSFARIRRSATNRCFAACAAVLCMHG